jgi:hemoglobin
MSEARRGDQVERRPYGEGDATHQALGGVEGIRRLVEAFYEEMDRLPEARRIRAMHPPDLSLSIDKLARFLSGWTGGPKLYSERYGPIRIPIAHRHLAVDESERDAWLACMKRALERRGCPEDLRRYMIEQLFVPAERIRVVSADRRALEANQEAE